MSETITLPKSVANAIASDQDVDAEYVVTDSGKDAKEYFEDTDRFIFYRFEAAIEISEKDNEALVRLVIQDKSSEKFYAVDYFTGAFDLSPNPEIFFENMVSFKEITVTEERTVVIKKTYSLL